MTAHIRSLKFLAPLVLAAAALPAHASLVLDTAVTAFFVPGATTTNTTGNDLPLPRPSTLYFGQLRATSSGVVDFFYIGNEAAYTNTLVLGNGTTFSTAGRPDTFNAPYPLIGSLAVSAGELLDFGFCTDGGASVLGSRCVWNDSAASIISQYDYQFVGGYRSIGFAAVDGFDPLTGQRTFPGGTGPRDEYWAFWDDSGAKNDDNHDDMIVGLRFSDTVRPTAVAEPTSLVLAVTGLLALMWTVSRRSRSAARAR